MFSRLRLICWTRTTLCLPGELRSLRSSWDEHLMSSFTKTCEYQHKFLLANKSIPMRFHDSTSTSRNSFQSAIKLSFTWWQRRNARSKLPTHKSTFQFQSCRCRKRTLWTMCSSGSLSTLRSTMRRMFTTLWWWQLRIFKFFIRNQV